jgi:exopolyphosphatase/pppGpp-phosphohydrolase
MQERILIDIGSSTVKVYNYFQNQLKLLLQRSLHFKEGFDPEGEISSENKKELFELLEAIKEENKNTPIRLYATGIFRKLAPETKVNFIDEVFLRTGLYFNIIDQDLENFYLEMALVGKCNLNEPLLLINIGGGSTELVVMYGKEAIERVNLDFGVGKILTDFPQINDEFSRVKLTDIVNYVKNLLPPIQNKPKIAFYTGGELTYMKLVNYPLKKNNLFEDEDHPFLIELEDFKNKNREIFEKISLKELENLMPENPKWMHGARPCSAIAQAICEKYNIEKIIPSDSNIINGIVRQEFRHVTLSGSFRKHLDYILEIKKKLETKGVIVLSPRFTVPKTPGVEFVVFQGEEGLSPLELERYRLNSIKNSDALIVCDPNGYVGASALLEIGFAHSLGKRIIFTEKPEEFILNNLPFEVGLFLD